jgi:L-alanine-DL-glutamate epimerase-like enolase superfamily enzyme
MKITAVEPILLSIPFEDGGAGNGITPTRWHTLDMVLVRVSTDVGLVGWGEAFAYFCQRPVAAVITDLVSPFLVGRDPRDPQTLNSEMQRRFALFGRYGITIFGISGVDIALWDLKAKAAGTSLSRLLRKNRVRESVQAYASLVRYGAPELVAKFSQKAVSEGYRAIKLHEVTMPAIRAGRQAIGAEPLFSVDVNCAWTEAFAACALPELKDLGALWLEEPVFPPEDWDAHRRLGVHGVAIAAGENACTAVEFGRLSQAVTYPQPSVIKMGGVSEFLKVAQSVAAAGQTLMAHTPYFGPGYHATLQLAAAIEPFGLLEYLWVEPAAWAAIDTPRPIDGVLEIPDALGIGFEPNFDVLERFRVGGPMP